MEALMTGLDRSLVIRASLCLDADMQQGLEHGEEGRGNCQLLPNGNAFINWGYDGAMSEHKPDGTTISFTRLEYGRLGPGS